MRKHVHHCNRIVIGSDLRSLEYAFRTNSTLIQNTQNSPHVFEKDELKRWNEYLISMSLAGKLPITKKIESARVDEGQLIVSLERSRPVRYTFEKLVIFSTHGVSGVEIEKKKGKKKVIDWFNVKSGMNHQIDKINTESDFVKEILFYPSIRMSGVDKNKKDLVAISFMKEEQLHDVEYSDSYVRLKTLSLMKEEGIQGNSHGKNKRHPIQIEHNKREIRDLGEIINIITPNNSTTCSYEDLKLENFSSDTYLSRVGKYFIGDI